MSANCDVIVNFPIYVQFWAIWKPDSRLTVCKIYSLITVTFYFPKIENGTKKSPTQLSYYNFE